MTDHTPGPWTIIPPNGPQGPFHGILSSEGWIVATQVVGAANARLIAAAPDLLAACERTEARLLLMAQFGESEDDAEWRESVSAAIAKARGESQ